MWLKATRRNDVERSEDNSTLSPWFSAVISNDVSSVESQLQHDTDVNALEVRSIFTARRVCITQAVPWQDVRLSHAGVLSKRVNITYRPKFF